MPYRRIAILSVAVAVAVAAAQLALVAPGPATADGGDSRLPAGAIVQAPTSSLVFTGIRPGTLILPASDTTSAGPDGTKAGPDLDAVLKVGGGCTANFIFQDTDTGGFDPTQTLYLGAAGHCFEPDDSALAVAFAPGTENPVLVNVGPVVYHIDTAGTDDFALIRIDDRLKSWVSPSMAHWGGPKGVHPSGSGNVILYTGHGVGVGPGGTPRVGRLHSFGNIAFQMTGVTNGGDSGAPVRTLEGLAVGQNIGLGGLDPWVPQTGPSGTSIHRMLALSGKALATCSELTPWPLPGCPPALP